MAITTATIRDGNNDRNNYPVNQAGREVVFRVLCPPGSQYEYLLPINMEGASFVGGRSGYAAGNGGTFRLRVCPVDSAGVPQTGTVLASEQGSAQSRFQAGVTRTGVGGTAQQTMYFTPRVAGGGMLVLSAWTILALVFDNVDGSPGSNFWSMNPLSTRGGDVGPHRNGVFDGSAGVGRCNMDDREAFGARNATSQTFLYGSFANFGRTEDTGTQGCRLPLPFGARIDNQSGALYTRFPYQSGDPLTNAEMDYPPAPTTISGGLTTIRSSRYNFASGTSTVRVRNLTTGQERSASHGINAVTSTLSSPLPVNQGDLIRVYGGTGACASGAMESHITAFFGSSAARGFFRRGTAADGSGRAVSGPGQIGVSVQPDVWHQTLTTSTPGPDPEPEPTPDPTTPTDALPSVAGAKGVKLSGAYLVAQDTLSGTRPPDLSSSFSMGGLFKPETLPVATSQQRLFQKADNPETDTETGIIAWLTTQFVRMARIGSIGGITGNYRSVWIDTGTEPVANTWYMWNWKYDASEGTSTFFVNGQKIIETPTSEPIVSQTAAQFVLGAAADGTLPFLGTISRFWIAEGIAQSDSWFQQLQTARVSGQTALSRITVNPTSLDISYTVGTTGIVQRSLQITQEEVDANPNFAVTSSSRIAVTGVTAAPATLSLSIDPSGLTTDTTLTVTITPADTTQPAFTVPVRVAVFTSNPLAPPQPTNLVMTPRDGGWTATVSNNSASSADFGRYVWYENNVQLPGPTDPKSPTYTVTNRVNNQVYTIGVEAWDTEIPPQKSARTLATVTPVASLITSVAVAGSRTSSTATTDWTVGLNSTITGTDRLLIAHCYSPDSATFAPSSWTTVPGISNPLSSGTERVQVLYRQGASGLTSVDFNESGATRGGITVYSILMTSFTDPFGTVSVRSMTDAGTSRDLLMPAITPDANDSVLLYLGEINHGSPMNPPVDVIEINDIHGAPEVGA
jgi:hypothetical protein